jgi:hypothetical protein
MVIVNIVEKEMWRRGLIAAGANVELFTVAFIISTFVEYRKESPLYGLAVIARDRLAKLVDVDHAGLQIYAEALCTFGWLKPRKIQIGDKKYVTGFELQHGSNLQPLDTVNEEQFKYDYKNVVSWDFVGADTND